VHSNHLISDNHRLDPLKSSNSDVLPMERYLLNGLPASAAVDSDGYRTYKGRYFVNLEQGGVVLVRKIPGTATCRAQLATELAPGPLLILDRATLTWKPAPLVPLTDIPNGLTMNPPDAAITSRERPLAAIDDPADADRQNAENHAPTAVHEGLNDRFETTMAAGDVVIARGLKQFPATEAALVRSEIQAVERIYADAQAALRANYTDIDTLLASYFGSAHAMVKPRFIEALTRGQALAAEYQGAWGESKIIGVQSNNKSRQGWVNLDDFHGRVFINLTHLEKDRLSILLGHEFLHTARISRFKSIGPSLRDFFYLNDKAQRSLKRSLPVYDSSWRGVSEVIMQGRLTLDYLQAFGMTYTNFIAGVREHSGVAGIHDIETALILFNASPAVRAQMAARNADSIICAADDLQRLHRARVAAAELLANLVHS
jgi:nucleotide-binding universal stress UspA family protein